MLTAADKTYYINQLIAAVEAGRGAFDSQPERQRFLVSLKALLPLVDDEVMNRQVVLDAAFPDMEPITQRQRFAKFAYQLNTIAEANGISCFLRSDNKRTAPATRECWWQGKSRVDVLLAYAQHTAAQQDDSKKIDSRAIEWPLRIFVSTAKDDSAIRHDLLDRIKCRLKAGSYDENSIDFWEFDKRLETTRENDTFKNNIDKAIKNSCIGLLLVSPDYLASDFIAEHEQPHFVPRCAATAKKPHKRALAVALVPVENPDRIDADDLFAMQVIGLDKPYATLRGDQHKNAFAARIADMLIDLLENPPPEDDDSGDDTHHRTWAERIWRDRLPPQPQDEDGKIVDAYVTDGSNDESSSVAVLDALTQWVGDSNGRPYMALLGEYGMGKTTACRLFTQQLLDRRQQDGDAAALLPVLLDLRYFIAGTAGLRKDSKPTLETILATIQQHDGADVPMDKDALQQLLRHNAAVVIFDGLDEVLVHLDATASTAFVDQLLSLLPPNTYNDNTKRQDGEQPPRFHGKLLLSYRPHFFRSHTEQGMFFAGLERQRTAQRDFATLVLLPFTDDQIRDYFTTNFAAAGEDAVALSTRVDNAMVMLDAVYNLRDLAARPYTLNLIRRQLARLQGATVVNTATLYNGVLDEWLVRDHPKHTIGQDLKTALMEQLALQLWRERKDSLSFDKVARWFDRTAHGNDDFISLRDHTQRELLLKNLRTATFIVRPEGDTFRFAHSSLFEFFLARALLAALCSDDLSAWALPRPSNETFDFLIDLLTIADGSDRQRAEHGLHTIASQYRQYVSENAFLFVVALQRRRQRPITVPTLLYLRNADLAEIRIDGGDQWLDFSGSCFANANLRNSIWHNVRLTNADMSDVCAESSQWYWLDAAGSDWRKSTVTGAVFRHAMLAKADFSDADIDKAQWLDVDLTNAAIAAPLLAQYSALISGIVITKLPLKLIASLSASYSYEVHCCVLSPDGRYLYSGGRDDILRQWNITAGSYVQTFRGHSGWVMACVLGSDGSYLYSGSLDKTLKQWDVATGSCLQTFTGHGGSVYACTISTDGRYLYSGSSDNTLKQWDVASGSCLQTFIGHDSAVKTCTLSRDGRYLYSGSADSTLKQWDVATGRCLQTFIGHDGWVMTCALNGDGTYLYSGSDDKTLRQWLVSNGECIQTFSGSDYKILTCTLSADGCFLYAGNLCRTVKQYDVSTGDCLRTFSKHDMLVWACMLSADDMYLYSGSGDGTIKQWDTASGECMLTIATFEDDNYAIIDHMQNRFIAASDGAWRYCYYKGDGGHTYPMEAFGPVAGIDYLTVKQPSQQ